MGSVTVHRAQRRTKRKDETKTLADHISNDYATQKSHSRYFFFLQQHIPFVGHNPDVIFKSSIAISPL